MEDKGPLKDFKHECRFEELLSIGDLYNNCLDESTYEFRDACPKHSEAWLNRHNELFDAEFHSTTPKVSEFFKGYI